MPGRFRIYMDESGTHQGNWLLIGMLFVPDHGSLHSELISAKTSHSYFNSSPKRTCKYKEVHLAEAGSPRDLAVARDWIDLFAKHSCYFRCVVVDWSIWKAKYFCDPFESEQLGKRRAYKKWAEMLLHNELKSPTDGRSIYHARFFLDHLKIAHNYDVIQELQSRFTGNYRGHSPYIDEFQYTESWNDANQCLQLCDLLLGCMYQQLVPSTNKSKLQIRDYLATSLKVFGVKQLSASYWRQYDKSTLNRHFPRFSAWFWKPSD